MISEEYTSTILQKEPLTELGKTLYKELVGTYGNPKNWALSEAVKFERVAFDLKGEDPEKTLRKYLDILNFQKKIQKYIKGGFATDDDFYHKAEFKPGSPESITSIGDAEYVLSESSMREYNFQESIKEKHDHSAFTITVKPRDEDESRQPEYFLECAHCGSLWYAHTMDPFRKGYGESAHEPQLYIPDELKPLFETTKRNHLRYLVRENEMILHEAQKHTGIVWELQTRMVGRQLSKEKLVLQEMEKQRDKEMEDFSS
jgi:hypothetical protein